MITPEVRSTPETLLDALLDARRVELALLDDLSDAQMLGPRGHFLEPPIWEMGHVGWFQEYWLLRRLDGADPLLPDADEIYDSFNVSYTQRWDHRFPSRAATLAYITEVLRRSVARLESREPRNDEAYFYTLAAQHEDMHAENLTAILQTLGHTRPASLRSAGAPPPACCSAAHSRVSSGMSGSGDRSGRGAREASTRAPSSAENVRPASPTRSTDPSKRLRSITMRIVSPSRTLPMGPPASASGPTWPMHAPVETPEKRASVITATCLPNDRCLSAAVIW